MKINMHMHSNNSDGKDTVNELVNKVKNDELIWFSITDHDNIQSCYEMEEYNLDNYVTGVELTAYLDKTYDSFKPYYTVHILAYDFDVFEMRNHLKNWQETRVKARLEFIRKFNRNNKFQLTVTVDRKVTETELIELGLCKNSQDVYDYICEQTNFQASVPTINQVVDAIHQANGFAIWAHPFETINYNQKFEFSNEMLEDVLKTMLKSKIDGLESDYFIYSEERKKYLRNLVKKHSLLYSIGTDYHGRERDAFSFDSDVRKDFFMYELENKRNNNKFIYLTNGRSGAQVYRDNDYVYKQKNNVQDLMKKTLALLNEKNFPYAPRLIEETETQNVFTFIKGFIPDNIGRTNDDQLINFMKVLRQFHDLTMNEENKEVVNHGDLSPCNVVFDGDEILGIIDFDSLYVGNRMDDVLHALILWVDLADESRDFNESINSIKLGLDEYGVLEAERKDIGDALIRRAEQIKKTLDPESEWHQRTIDWIESTKNIVFKNLDLIKEIIG